MHGALLLRWSRRFERGEREATIAAAIADFVNASRLFRLIAVLKHCVAS